MSEADRKRWNERYKAGAYGQRTHPSALLATMVEQWLPVRGGARALDLACGAGRNALYLAEQGYQVDACLLYTSPSPRDKRQSRMPSSA